MAFSQQVQHLVGNIHVVGGLGRGRIRLSPHLPGVLADPVQSRLGIHRRRLMRLIDTLEVEMRWQQTPSPREHFFLRSAFDLWDAGVFHYDYRGALISLGLSSNGKRICDPMSTSHPARRDCHR
jgi:hypothetical protein